MVGHQHTAHVGGRTPPAHVDGRTPARVGGRTPPAHGVLVDFFVDFGPKRVGNGRKSR